MLFVSCFISFTRIKIVSQIFRNRRVKIREVITILNQIAKLCIAVLRVRSSLILLFVLIQPLFLEMFMYCYKDNEEVYLIEILVFNKTAAK